MAIRVSLFSLIFLSSSLIIFSLYEDQVSLMDWHQQYLGKVKQTIFHTQKDGRKRLVVSTHENVVASLDPRRREIFWRHVLGEKDPIDYIDIALGKYVVTLSSKGSILRAWNLPDGQMVWESLLVGKKPSGSSLLTVIDLKADCDNAVLVYSNGCLHAISSIDGAVLWNLELESVELQQLIQPFSDNVMYVVGFSGSSKLNAYGINIKTGKLLYQEVVDFPSGKLSLISSETSVALNEDHSFMLEVLAMSCGLELIHVKQVYENINDQTLTKKHVRKALDTLDLQKKQNIFKCLRENYVTSPISGEDAHPVGWFHKILYSHLPKLTPNVDSRRILAQAPSPTHNFAIPIPGSMSPPTTKNVGGNSASVSTRGNEGGGNSHTTIVVAVVVTAVVTFFVVLCLYCCCRKAFNGGSSLEHKDDRPLLSLSMSDYAASGSSKAWGFENSAHKDKMGSNMNSSAVEFSNNVVASEAAIRSSNVSSDSNVLPSRKPPPGLPPLKPPPGRKDLLPPLSPEPRVSLKPATNSGDRPPPPPPPKPPVAAPPPPPKPRAPPPPPNKGPPPPPNKGPSPLGPPPPPAKPGPKAPPGQSNKSRLPPVSGSSSDDASKTKLKPFFWDKVQANPEHSMVWGQLQSGSFQFNEDMIESLFGLASTENKNEKKKQSSARDPSTQFIQIIEPKKAQNLSILLKALNVTTDEVHDALVEGNELPSELLETLLKMAPTAEEELKLRLFDDEISKLGQAERFLKVLVDIPFAFKRLETLLFMCTLNEEATAVKESFITLEAACKELRNSRLFLKLLEAVLKTGNRMNDGTYRGGAQAFKLDTLLKLADVKGTDGKTTLLHFVVQEIIRSEGVRAYRTSRESKSFSSIKSEDVLEDVTGDSEEHLRSLGLQVVSGLGDQLENVKKAACLDSDSVTRTLAKLGNSLLKANNFLGKEMEEVDEVNGFHEALKSFIGHSEGEVMKLLEEEKRIMALVKSTVDYFHGNSGKEEGLRLFVIVRDFLIMLDKACQDVKAKPLWPAKEDQKKDDEKKKDPPSRQTSTETPRTTFSSDFRQKFFPAIAERRTRNDGSSSDED